MCTPLQSKLSHTYFNEGHNLYCINAIINVSIIDATELHWLVIIKLTTDQLHHTKCALHTCNHFNNCNLKKAYVWQTVKTYQASTGACMALQCNKIEFAKVQQQTGLFMNYVTTNKYFIGTKIKTKLKLHDIYFKTTVNI